MAATTIRESGPQDADAILRIYPQAFPDEDLVPLVRQLLTEPAALSLVAVEDGEPVGHVVFTDCGVEDGDGRVALLGPLCVAPARHRQGIGSLLVREGLERMRERGAALSCVLGDPSYYGRFGYTAERDLETPYPIPEAWRDAWQSLALSTQKPTAKGRLSVPQPWLRPELWADEETAG